MILESLASLLDNVRWLGSERLVAICPSHPDKTPSLNAREGERCILLKCWAGCTINSICSAIGISVSDLFYDRCGNPAEIQRHQARRQYEKAKSEVARMVTGFQIDAVREAERFLGSARGIDISQWRAELLDHETNLVCDALTLILEEQRDAHA